MKKNLLITLLLISTLFCYSQDWSWLENQSLSYHRAGLTAAVLDDSIFFSGGSVSWLNTFSNTVDIYDVGENSWTSNELPDPVRFQTTTLAAGGKVFIAGGHNYTGDDVFNEVNIFTKETGEWTVEYLSQARAIYMGGVAYGSNVYFAGGTIFNTGATSTYYSDVIDIYDLVTETWSTANLSGPRGFVGATAAGGKVFFAGGAIGDLAASDVIDVYDTLTNSWYILTLSESRGVIAAVAYEDKVYFVGGTRPAGSTCTVIDIYNTSTDIWEDQEYLQNQRIVNAINVENALLFSGACNSITFTGPGYIYGFNGVIEIYYPHTGQWDYTVPSLDPPRQFYAIAAYNNKAYFAGGRLSSSGTTATVNVLEYMHGHIIHIPDDQPTIQAGIDVAFEGDTILVAEGTYYEHIDYKGKAITVASHFLIDGNEDHIDNTIIDGSQPVNPDSASVVSFVSGEDTTSVLYGFTIQNGTGTNFVAFEMQIGGGIACLFSSAKIIHNHIINNQVDQDFRAWGGGIFAWDDYSTTHFILKGNTIDNNYSHNTNDYPGGAVGGGCIINGMIVLIENNIVANNTADGRPYGAGLCIRECNGMIRNNIIINNTANSIVGSSKGAGLYIENQQDGLTIIENTITDNQIIDISGTHNEGGGIGVLVLEGYENNEILFDNNIVKNNYAGKGAGIYFWDANNALVSNNIVQSNEAYILGGGVCMEYANKSENSDNSGFRNSMQDLKNIEKSKSLIPVFVNNTITDNSSGSGGGFFINIDNDLLAFNNIIYNNTADQGPDMYIYHYGTTAYLYNNDINTNNIGGNGIWSGDDNIDSDPEFDVDGYHLLPTSQCIEAGIQSIEIDEETYFCPDHDIDGHERPLNTTADIGADEVLITGLYESIPLVNDLLLQSSPNPFSGTTTILFELKSDCYAELSIYDLTGKKIQPLISENRKTGLHEFVLDARWLENGVYFCVLKTSEGKQITKMIKM